MPPGGTKPPIAALRHHGYTTRSFEEQEAAAEGEDEGGEEAEGEPEEGEPEDPRGMVPSFRVREQTERADAAEERARALETQMAEMRGQLTELSARVNAIH